MLQSKNIPNILTISRIILCPVWFAMVYYNYHTTALIIIIFVSITDYFDGLIARKYNIVSSLGKMMDPIADKILVTVVLITFTADSRANIILVILIIVREISISGLREYLATKNKSAILKVTLLSKIKTSFQFFSILLLSLVPLIINQAQKLENIGNVFLLISAILSIYSGYKYVKLALKEI